MEEMMNTSDAVEEIQYIVVKLGDEQYGIDIRYVDNIVRLSKITRVAKSQPYYVGVINLRGEVVPIMSLRRRFGLLIDISEQGAKALAETFLRCHSRSSSQSDSFARISCATASYAAAPRLNLS